MLECYGYLLLFVVGFLEYAGAPIASIPVLVVAGALAAMGGIPLPGIVLAAALGGLTSDLIWYAAARTRGQRLVDVVCGLATNPMACVTVIERRIRAVGPLYLLPSKFIPGGGQSGGCRFGLRRYRPAAVLGVRWRGSVVVGCSVRRCRLAILGAG
jgi:membrane protein DedA with SNARE-associated domain